MALIDALENENYDHVYFLISQGIGLNERDMYGNTPLRLAVMNDFDAVRMLILAGADVDVPNYYGDTPISTAASELEVDVVRMLIRAGANVNVKNDHGETPLMIVIKTVAEDELGDREDRNKIVAMLLGAGARVDVTDRDGMTPMMYANALNRTDIAHMLKKRKLQRGIKIDIEEPPYKKRKLGFGEQKKCTKNKRILKTCKTCRK